MSHEVDPRERLLTLGNELLNALWEEANKYGDIHKHAERARFDPKGEARKVMDITGEEPDELMQRMVGAIQQGTRIHAMRAQYCELRATLESPSASYRNPSEWSA